jgi:hypothetical protein
MGCLLFCLESATMSALPPGLFQREKNRFYPTEACRGPWDRNAMHGGPPSALMARLALEHQPGGTEWFVSRLTSELLRPVPLEVLNARVEIRRPGRRLQLIDVSLFTADGTEVCMARVLRMAINDNGLDESSLPASGPPDVMPPEQCGTYDLTARHEPGMMMFGGVVEVRPAEGNFFETPGPGQSWFRLMVPTFVGEEIHPLDRACTTGDFPNAVSSVLAADEHLFINPDVTVHLHRLPVGDWVLLSAQTHVRRAGYGIAAGILSDRDGQIGTTVQSLLVASRP